MEPGDGVRFQAHSGRSDEYPPTTSARMGLDGFGGDQKFAGIVDAAGGFYQFLIHPRDRHKTAFVLPTSMGGTTFQWLVAPYGLSRNRGLRDST